MVEKREQRRFSLNLYTYLRADDSLGTARTAAATTRDISSAGAYLELDTPFPVGTRTAVSVCLRPVSGPNETSPVVGEIKVLGTVLRSEPGGMAVQFDREFDFIESRSLV